MTSAGTQIDFSATDIALSSPSGWTRIGCILDAERDGIALEIEEQEGCLNDAVASPVMTMHKTTKSVNEGKLSGTIDFNANDYAALRTRLRAGTKGYYRFVDPDNRDPVTGALTITTSSAEKIFGWVTELGKSHPAGGGRVTAKFTLTVDTSTYVPKV